LFEPERNPCELSISERLVTCDDEPRMIASAAF
jgi:hypothetical protein